MNKSLGSHLKWKKSTTLGSSFYIVALQNTAGEIRIKISVKWERISPAEEVAPSEGVELVSALGTYLGNYGIQMVYKIK